jgi:flavin reductase (DIM6/NTAB) family NADH-FMN oxidoreductase RutF
LHKDWHKRGDTAQKPPSTVQLELKYRIRLLVYLCIVMNDGKANELAHDAGFETIAPKILYFGTPVAIVSSANENGTTNLAPLSSFWALGWTLVLGLLQDTKTLQNLEARPECVVNLPSPELWPRVELLAPLTGLNPVPPEKADRHG